MVRPFALVCFGFFVLASAASAQAQSTSCPPGTKPVPETDNCAPVSRSSGPNRRPRDTEIPRPGSGKSIPVSARDAAQGSWTGCRPYKNRFKEAFQRCCQIDSGVRSCRDQY